MIHDATVEVTCDAEGCDASISIDLDFVYDTYSGESGHYSTGNIEEKLTSKGWSTGDDKQYCDDCTGYYVGLLSAGHPVAKKAIKGWMLRL